MLLIKHGKWFLVVGLLLLSCRWGWLNNSTNTIGIPSTAEVGVVFVANSHCRSQVSIVSRVDLCNLTQSNLSTVAAANRVYKSLHSNSHYTTRRQCNILAAYLRILFSLGPAQLCYCCMSWRLRCARKLNYGCTTHYSQHKYEHHNHQPPPPLLGSEVRKMQAKVEVSIYLFLYRLLHEKNLLVSINYARQTIPSQSAAYFILVEAVLQLIRSSLCRCKHTQCRYGASNTQYSTTNQPPHNADRAQEAGDPQD